jgi:hypothetical protein
MKIHINAVFNAIDGLFSEAVEVTDETLRAEIIEGEANIKGSIYQYQPIYTRNTEALRALSESRLSAYLKQHPDNSLQLFVETEVKTARLHQSHLPKFKTDSKQKTYFFRLKRWIEVLEEMLPQQAEAKPKKLGVPIIALIHIYEGILITKENAGEIAAKHGYTAKTSGIGLYHDYLKYLFTSDRTAKPTAETKKTLENKIELFESVLNHLSNKAKQQAIDEINILKTILETEYQ